MSFNLGEELNKVTKPYVTQAQQGEAIKQLLRDYTKAITPSKIGKFNEHDKSIRMIEYETGITNGYNEAITTIEANSRRILGDE